jgi:alanine racemase
VTDPIPAVDGQVRPTVAEIDLDAIRHNVARLRDVAGAEVCAVVKADGYGHGAVPVARAALDGGATWLAVALVEEGEELREAGIDAPILVLTEPPTWHAGRLLDAGLTTALYSSALGRELDRLGRERGRPVDVHLKIDSGMSRVGVPPADWDALFAEAATWEGVSTQALWTHLARADEPAATTTDEQLDAFDDALARARDAGLTWDLEHAANSAATLIHPRARRDLVRPGIAIYGLSPSDEVDAADHDLRPALRLVTHVAFAKHVPAGTRVSYGHRFETPTAGWLATLQVGYADGVPRLLTNRADVLIGGRRQPIAGTVCMDQVVVWCGDREPEVGEEVVLLGGQGDEQVRAEEWAAAASTITYEIATSITARVPRVHVGA